MDMLAGLYTEFEFIRRTLESDSLEMVLLLIHANANRSTLEHDIVDHQRRAALRHRQSRVSNAAVGHVKQDVGQLHSLAHSPVEERDVVGRGHFGGVQNNILQGNVEVDSRVKSGVPAKVEERVGKVWRGLEHRPVGGISHDDGINVRLERLAQTVRAGGYVDNSGSARGAPNAGIASIRGVGIVKGSLDSSPVVCDAVALGTKVRLDVAEDGPVLAIGNERTDSVMFDVLVPVAGRVSGLEAFRW